MTAVRSPVREAVCTIVGAQHVVDAGFYRLGRVEPALAARPESEEQISRLLALASAEHLAVIPWGRGLHQALGRRPSRYDLALDLTRLDRVLAHEPADLTATVQVGVTLGALERQLTAASQFLPLEPARRRAASLGGVLATNLSGPWRCRYGTARDLTLGLRVVHADGTATKAGAKVVKNATAYDLTKLYLGSHGTLGVVTEATLRLFPRPEAERTWWLPTVDPERAQALADRVLASPVRPDRLELLDARAAAGCGVRPPSAGLLVSCGGVEEALIAQGEMLGALGQEARAPLSPNGNAASCWQAVADYPWESSEVTHTVLWRASVLPASVAKAMRAAEACAGETAEAAAIATVSDGAVRGRLTARDVPALEITLRALRAGMEDLGGFLVVLDAPEPVRERIDVWGEPPEAIEVMRRLKQRFDPSSVLSPGRFVGGI